MTLGGVRDFFRTTLNALGLKEWPDGFNIENIPATILDGAYHLDSGRITVTNMGVNGTAYECEYPVTLKVLSKGFRDSGKAIDAAIDKAQSVISGIVGAVDDLDQTKGLKHVHPQDIQTQPLQISNTHAVICTMTFNAVFIFGV